MQTEASRTGLDAEADIGHAAGNEGRDGCVRKLNDVVADDFCALKFFFLQQQIEQYTRSRSGLPVDETALAFSKIR